MKKGLLIFICVLMLLVSCAFAETAELEDKILATAYDGKVELRLSEAQTDFDEMLAYYVSMYQMYGQSIDEYDLSFQELVAQNVVENDIDVMVVKYWAAENGYDMTEEHKAEIEAEAKAQYDEIYEYYVSYMTQYGIEGEELEQTVQEELAASGYTYEDIVDTFMLQDMLEYVYNLAVADVTVTDEEVEEHFNTEIAEQKETYDADVDSFINDYMSGVSTLYVPEGVRLVRLISVNPVDTEATGDEAEQTETDPNQLTGEAKANAIYALIMDGMDFSEAAKAYADDGGDDTLYAMAAGTAMYGSDDLVNGAMALEKVGDVSPVIATDYGYFIFYYDQDLTAGSADFADYKEAETDELLESRKQEAYSAFIDKILEEANIVKNDTTALYHVYVGEDMEAFSQFALTAAETAVADQPNGIVMANAEAGTAVEVLGTITVDGTKYGFVSVLGTEVKGYVPYDALTETDEAAAYDTDNTGKVEEAKQDSSALPIYTLVMKDGSIVYGELYPETAPESVGNFTELANSGFYDGLIFHRVISGFMIQGGDPQGTGIGGPGYSIKGEFSENGVENNLSHERGVISMARSSDNDSAGSQFFIMHADTPSLDGSYAAFGRTLGGLETVDVIASVPVDGNDKPRNEQAIRTIYVETHGNTYEFTKLED